MGNKIRLSKKSLIIIIVTLLILTGFYLGDKFIESKIQDIFKETILSETAPNGNFDLEIESSSFFDFGSGIIVYVKDNTSKDSKLMELCHFNIHQDMTAIHSDHVDLTWDNGVAILSINGEAETLDLTIWREDKTGVFQYKANSDFFDRIYNVD